MTHYQKLATLIFRITGVFLLVLSAISFAIALFFIVFGAVAIGFGSGGGLEIGVPLLLIYTLPTALIGIVFFKLSVKLALKVCFDLDE